MKLQTVIVVVGSVVLQGSLALTPLIPATSSLWHLDDPIQFYSRLGLLLGLQFTILTAAVLLTVESEIAKLTPFLRQILSAFPLIVVRKLKDFEFYSHFKHEVELAKDSVRISYFAPYPPDNVKVKDRKKYYDDLLALMKHRDRVSFKRLVRSTDANEPWLASLISELHDRANNDVAVIRGDLPATVEMPLAMSVQVVDERKCWLVALSKHEQEGEFRDIYIEDAEIARAMAQYFDRTWASATRLLDRGRITDQGAELINRVRGNEEKQ